MACGQSGDDTGTSPGREYAPEDATSFTYEVAYGNPEFPGTAEVTYTSSDGEQVHVEVTMPWRSETIMVRDGQSYQLVAKGEPRADASFRCRIYTDNGWDLGSSGAHGDCSYTFPDDLDDFPDDLDDD